jgi:hypothetical protein
MGLTQSLRLDRLNLRTKLIATFVVVALLVGVTGAVGYQGVSTLDDEAHLIAQNGENMDHAAEMLVGIEQQQVAVQSAALGEAGAQSEFEEANSQFNEHAAGMDASGEMETQLGELEATHEEYNALAATYFEAKENGNEELAGETLSEMNALRTELEEQAHTLEGMSGDAMAAQVAAADSETQTVHMEIIGLTIVAFLVAIGLGVALSRT